MDEGSMHPLVPRTRNRGEHGGGGHHPVVGERARELCLAAADARVGDSSQQPRGSACESSAWPPRALLRSAARAQGLVGSGACAGRG
jgi:hypothetical protein